MSYLIAPILTIVVQYASLFKSSYDYVIFNPSYLDFDNIGNYSVQFYSYNI